MEIVEFNHEEAANYLQSISLERFASNLFKGEKSQRQSINDVLSHGGADFLPITIDSPEKVAAKLLREEHEGIKLLNGFPLTITV